MASSADRPDRSKGWRIGVDIGGTFTDVVIVDPDGEMHVLKVPSQPDHPARAVLDGLEAAAETAGTSQGELLRSCTLLTHGSTVATNTLLEHKGATVGLLTTEGFRDSLEIRRGIRPDPWLHRQPYPPVLVPRYLRLPVSGRLDRQGEELSPISREDVRAAIEVFRQEGVEAVAVALLNSFLDGTHERTASEELRSGLDEAWLYLSSEVAPIIGEYERTSTVVLNAYVGPRTVGYVRDLDAELRERGLQAPLLLTQNNGGAMSVEQVVQKPAALLLSGPAAGVGALGYYARAVGTDNLLSMEIGGTSSDVMLMSHDGVPVTDLLEIGGYHLALPSVDIHTIGAGGGTIAGVDEGGMLFVGPAGAGAVPGPAAYGRGGVEPTVTDAQMVLGRLASGVYAGGAVSLDGALAETAVRERIAQPLGLAVSDAAQGVVRLIEQKLLHAVQQISVERGHDPRRFTLVAAGGAGPLHGPSVARLLGCPRVYVPRLAGAFCALGMLHSDVRHDFVRVFLGRLDDDVRESMQAALDELRGQAQRTLQAEGFADGDRRYVYICNLRYRAQQWDVAVTLPGHRVDIAEIRNAFEQEHERLFGHTQPENVIEVTRLGVSGIGHIPKPSLALPPPASETPVPVARRRVWIDAEAGWMDAVIHDGSSLGPGQDIEGPALVNEPTTTVFVGHGDRLHVDAYGNYLIEIAS